MTVIYQKTIGDKEMADGVGRFYISAHVPTLALTYKKKSDTVGEIKGTKLHFPTKLSFEISNKHQKMEIRILGFGFVISYYEE